MYPSKASEFASFPNAPLAKKRPQSPPRRRGPLKKRKVVVIRQKPSVRFHEDIEVYNPRAYKTPVLPSTTWLKEKDLSRIRENIFSTLEVMKRTRDTGVSRRKKDKGKHCFRGLEDYSIDQKGSLKASTIHRRQNAIRAVLHEQGMQRKQEHRRRNHSSKIDKHGLIPFHPPILDHAKLAEVYRNQTTRNVHEAIHTGRVDSEQALAIYSEPPPLPLLQAPPQAHRRQQPEQRFGLLPSSKKPRRAVDTTWGFPTTTIAPAPTLPPSRPLHRRIVSIS